LVPKGEDVNLFLSLVNKNGHSTIQKNIHYGCPQHRLLLESRKKGLARTVAATRPFNQPRTAFSAERATDRERL